MSELVSEEQYLAWFEELSNWNRWGFDDKLGTLNFVSSEAVCRASGLVRSGIHVSCAHDIDPNAHGDPRYTKTQRYFYSTGQGLKDPERVISPDREESRFAAAAEYIGLIFHGMTITHLDALSHIFWDASMYGGRAAEKVTSAFGATELPVTDVRDGIVARGVLFDIPRVRGVEALGPGSGVTPADLEEAEKKFGVTVEEGDVVLLRTGFPGADQSEAGSSAIAPCPGWDLTSLPWLHERRVAVVGADNGQEVRPAQFEDRIVSPFHAVAMVAMGLWMIDNCNLELLAETCARLQRWEFFFVLAPLRFLGATGSPANPIAIF
jgi:kynurenine formamidase